MFNPSTPLIAPFDSKLLPHNDGEVSDQMPVVVSGNDVEKLLDIPKGYPQEPVLQWEMQ